MTIHFRRATVLNLIKEGRNMREIADQLCMSLFTVNEDITWLREAGFCDTPLLEFAKDVWKDD